MTLEDSTQPVRKGSIELLATLGPASLDRRTITRLDEAGVTLFRVNLSHTDVDALEDIVELVRAQTRVPICFDSEGAQIRTGSLESGEVRLEAGQLVALRCEPETGGQGAREEGAWIPLVPRGTAHELEAGDLVSLDFNGSLLQVMEREAAGDVRARVLRGGVVGSNKAVSLQRSFALPALTEEDRRAIEIGRQLGIRHFALSFAAEAEDVAMMRALAGPEAFIISKIESRRALQNLDAIAKASDALLIDRGDLSREVTIDQIPRIQRAVIARGRSLETPVYVATNLLESMLEAPTPTRAEVNDVYTTLRDGANGLVLAAETAIGRNPVQCANMVMKIAAGNPAAEPSLTLRSTSQLVRPHGLEVPDESLRRTCGSTPTLPSEPEALVVTPKAFDLAAQLANGSLSPLSGFMDQQQWTSVQRLERLPDATPWPCPITLRVPANEAVLKPGHTVVLEAPEREGALVMHISQALAAPGGTQLAGRVHEAKQGAVRSHPLELPPTLARASFEARGWRRVAGAVVARFDADAIARWTAAQFEQTAVDGVILAVCSSLASQQEDALELQRAILEAVGRDAANVVVAGLPRLWAPSPLARRRLDAIRLKNHGCSHVGFELDTGRGTRHENRVRSVLRSGAAAPISPQAG